jgi:hypothetical protein
MYSRESPKVLPKVFPGRERSLFEFWSRLAKGEASPLKTSLSSFHFEYHIDDDKIFWHERGSTAAHDTASMNIFDNFGFAARLRRNADDLPAVQSRLNKIRNEGNRTLHNANQAPANSGRKTISSDFVAPKTLRFESITAEQSSSTDLECG